MVRVSANRHVPLRRCRVCRTQHPKADLQRWVQSPGGPVADPGQRLPGRGFYACGPECAAKLTANWQKAAAVKRGRQAS